MAGIRHTNRQLLYVLASVRDRMEREPSRDGRDLLERYSDLASARGLASQVDAIMAGEWREEPPASRTRPYARSGELAAT
jgi:hypothetical protein